MPQDPRRPALPAALVVAAAAAAGLGGYLLAKTPPAPPGPSGSAVPTWAAPPRAPASTDPGPSPVAPLGDGYAVVSLGARELALVHLDRAAKTPAALRLLTIYRVRSDPTRHLLTPEARATHGVYLDDLGALFHRALTRDQAAFQALADARAVGTAEVRRLGELAASLLQRGDATVLRAALTHESYAARRAAALALGAAGFRISAPVLGEVLGEGEGPMVETARSVLRQLSGREIRTREDVELWWRTLPARERYGRRAHPSLGGLFHPPAPPEQVPAGSHP